MEPNPTKVIGTKGWNARSTLTVLPPLRDLNSNRFFRKAERRLFSHYQGIGFIARRGHSRRTSPRRTASAGRVANLCVPDAGSPTRRHAIVCLFQLDLHRLDIASCPCWDDHQITALGFVYESCNEASKRTQCVHDRSAGGIRTELDQWLQLPVRTGAMLSQGQFIIRSSVAVP